MGLYIVFCGFAQKIGVFGARSSMNWKNWGEGVRALRFPESKVWWFWL